MLEREIVSVEQNATVGGGLYVHDDHIKNVYELLYAALSGYRWTVIHGNKRYGFRDEAAWQVGVKALQAARANVEFEDEAGSRRRIHRLDVNAANVDELRALAAIGRVLAARIVADRADRGDFASVDDLGRVHGIGPGRLRSLRTVLRV